jgi:hypothetical protein
MKNNGQYSLLRKDKLRKGMVIRFEEDLNNPNKRNWIVLLVTKKDLKRGVNAENEGLHAFGGMWYGRNPMKIKSYGKILPIEEDVYLIHRDLQGIKVDEFKNLVE